MSEAAIKWVPTDLDFGSLDLVGNDQGFVFGEAPAGRAVL